MADPQGAAFYVGRGLMEGHTSHAFDTEKARRVAAEQSSLEMRASGELAQHITNLRRRLRI